MFRPIFALVVLVGLSGCAELGYPSGPWGQPSRTPSRRAPTYDRGYDDATRTPEYRRVRSDAAQYANQVDRALRLGSRDEARIRDIVERRAVDLLRRTRARDHSRVYPFPRSRGRNGSFWSGADRDIERVLDRQDRDDYRYFVRHGTRRPDNRTDRGGRNRGYDDGDRRDRRDRGRAGRDDDRRGDRVQRPGETLEEWYRRQRQGSDRDDRDDRRRGRDNDDD